MWGFFFQIERGLGVDVCVWPIRFTSRCLAQLFSAAWVPGCHHWALCSHLTHKWKSIWTWGCHSPRASLGIHSLRTCHDGFYKASGSGCHPPSFPNLLAVPQIHKTHIEKCLTGSDRNVLWGFTPSHFLKLPHIVVSFPHVSNEKAQSPELNGAGNRDVYSIVNMLVLEVIPHVSCLSPAPWLAS